MSAKKEPKVENLLGDVNKGMDEVLGPNQVLSLVFRKMLYDNDINISKWNRLMNRYLNDPTNRIPKHSKGRSSVRGNLTKELMKPVMTWNNFFKGIKFLNPDKVELSFNVAINGEEKQYNVKIK
jgi:hypothetical protein